MKKNSAFPTSGLSFSLRQTKNIIGVFFFPIIQSILLFSHPAFALSDYISIDCPSTATIDTPANCTISGYSSTPVSSISAKVSTENLTVQTFSADPAWSGNINDNKITVSTNSAKTGSFTIGTVSVQPVSIDASGTITLSDVVFSNNNLTDFSVSSIISSISATSKEPSTNSSSNNVVSPSPNPPETPPANTSEEENTPPAPISGTLKSLTIKDYDLDFVSDKYTYSLQIDNNINSLEITATPTDENATVKITGNENLTDGSIVKITVKNDSEESIYRIKISYKPLIIESTKNSSTINITAIIIISASVILISTIAIFFFVRTKKKKNITKDTPPIAPQAAPRLTENPFIKPPVSPQNTSPTPPVQSTTTPRANTNQPTQPTPAQPASRTTSQFTPSPTPPSAQPAQPKQSISLDEIPFNQNIPSYQAKKPATPFIFES